MIDDLGYEGARGWVERVEIGLKAVLQSGFVEDVYSRSDVLHWAIRMGFYETAEFIEERPVIIYEFIIKVTDWENVPCVLTERLKEAAKKEPFGINRYFWFWQEKGDW